MPVCFSFPLPQCRLPTIPVSNEVRKKNRLRQYNTILTAGSVIDTPCEHCSNNFIDCVIDSKSQNCAECTRRGRKCVKRFHNDREWESLERDRQKVALELEQA